jgi:hypothetical protein
MCNEREGWGEVTNTANKCGVIESEKESEKESERQSKANWLTKTRTSTAIAKAKEETHETSCLLDSIRRVLKRFVWLTTSDSK